MKKSWPLAGSFSLGLVTGHRMLVCHLSSDRYFEPKFNMSQINWDKIPSFYHRYVQQVDQLSLEGALQQYAVQLNTALDAIPETQWNYRYAPGKWSIKEMVQHIIDTERIMAYRALCFARGEQQSLPGFDENAYANHSHADYRSKESLLREFNTVHQTTRMLFESFTRQQIDAAGTANGNGVYVGGLGYIIAGHALHHLSVLQERYLAPLAQNQHA